MDQQIEFVKYQKLKHIRFLVNQIDFKEGHIHNEIEVFLVLKGSGKTEILNQTYNIQTGDIYFINSSIQVVSSSLIDLYSFSTNLCLVK